MKNIKEIGDFFINLNEYVYATDIETNEIVYMNHIAPYTAPYCILY